jgi:adenosylcobyric acid synthase
VQDTLNYWRDRCDVLLLEGAGSPVELNLMHRDLVNLRPIQFLQGRWLLVGDIERGGVFAQMVGTHALLPEAAQAQGLGLIVNKFRGDLTLFQTAEQYFQQHLPRLPYLGVLPYQPHLQPESEDSLCQEAETGRGWGAVMAWIRFPYLSNSQDSQPWQLDPGIQVQWVRSPAELASARVIVLPGSKNTLADLQWLRETGLATAIQQAAAQRIPVVGICGGYQMLGERLIDKQGLAGQQGDVAGLGLLPAITTFAATKTVQQVQAQWGTERWTAYEIHMGYTDSTQTIQPLFQVQDQGDSRPEGMQQENVWGTYLHGCFESAALRQALMHRAGIECYHPASLSWTDHQNQLYGAMANLLEEHLNLEPIQHYLLG